MFAISQEMMSHFQDMHVPEWGDSSTRTPIITIPNVELLMVLSNRSVIKNSLRRASTEPHIQTESLKPLAPLMGGWPRHFALFSPQVQEIRAAIFRVIEHIVPTIQVLHRGPLPAEVKGGTSSRCYCDLPCNAGDVFVHLAMVIPPHLRRDIPELNLV
jgi:hypothetical protein